MKDFCLISTKQELSKVTMTCHMREAILERMEAGDEVWLGPSEHDYSRHSVAAYCYPDTYEGEEWVRYIASYFDGLVRDYDVWCISSYKRRQVAAA